VIPTDFAQFICARKILLHTSIIDEPCQNNLFKFITENTLEKFRIRSFGANHGKTTILRAKQQFCELLVTVIIEIHFYTFQIL
jgi:hypothetical protein